MGELFDQIARVVASPMPRWQALRRLVSRLAGTLLAAFGLDKAWSQSSRRELSMQHKPIGRSLALCLSLLLAAGVVWACNGGSVAPICSRTIYLAKFVPMTVVVPSSGPITVPIGALPYVSWSSLWDKPQSAKLTFTLTCTPVGGGPSTVIGPQSFPQPTPVTPGPQPAGPFLFMIPAGTFPPGSLPQICAISGTYTVSFGPGTGGGPTNPPALSATGDAHVCLVQPAPGNENKPRLEVRYLAPPGEQFLRLRAGVQGILQFLIANNDPKNAVTLDLTSEGRQTAVLPDGFTAADRTAAYNAHVHALSSPVPGTDTFPAQFADQLSPGQLVPETDPHQPAQPLSLRGVTIGPLEARPVSIAMRSFGMCANGSCNERFVRVEGTFADGSRALACASSLLLVDDVPPGWPLFESEDSIKVSRSMDAVWRPTEFNNEAGTLPNAATFAGGNRPPTEAPGFQLKGELRRGPNEVGFPSSATASVGTYQVPTRLSYSVDAFPPGGAATVQNNVVVSGLPGSGKLQIPLILPQPARPASFNVRLDASADVVIVQDSQNPDRPVKGTLTEFRTNPPPGFAIDPETCRIFTMSDQLGRPTISTDPLFVARLSTQDSVPQQSDRVSVHLNPPDNNARWTARVVGAGARVRADSGPIGTPIEVVYDLAGTQPAPETNCSFLVIEVPGAINGPWLVPICLRYTVPGPLRAAISTTRGCGESAMYRVGEELDVIVRIDGADLVDATIDGVFADGRVQPLFQGKVQGNATIAMPLANIGGTLGKRAVRLQARAGDRVSNVAECSFIVAASNPPPGTNQPPIANPGGPYTATATCARQQDRSWFCSATVTLDGGKSYDPDGSVVSYNWDFGDGQKGSGKTVQHSYAFTLPANPPPGAVQKVFKVCLTVTDNQGAQSAQQCTTVTITSTVPGF